MQSHKSLVFNCWNTISLSVYAKINGLTIHEIFPQIAQHFVQLGSCRKLQLK